MNPEVRVFQDFDSISRAAAHIFIEQAEQSIQEIDRFLVALSGGSTPRRLFELLTAGYAGKVNWTKIHVFWDDERCVPANDTESNYGQAHSIWLSHVNIPETNIHRIKGELNPTEAAKEYAGLLKQFASPPLDWPRFDLVFLGLGEDGHTASLFPGSPVEVAQPTMAVTAHYQDRPAERVTLTPPVFNSARMIVFMATGEKKAEILVHVLGGTYQPAMYPAQRIDPQDGKLIWLLDESVASLLKH